MQKINLKLSQRVIEIQKFIINNMPAAVEVPTLSKVMMEIVLREANNSETDVLEEMVKDMMSIKGMSVKDPRATQVALETVCGAYHFYDIYNGFDELMYHLDDIFYHVQNSSVSKFKRRVMRSDLDLDEFDLDLTTMTTMWFGAAFTGGIQKVFDKYIVDRGHYDTIFVKNIDSIKYDNWPDDSTPLSEQMKIRAVFLLVITVISMM